MSTAGKRARKQWDEAMAASGIRNKFTEQHRVRKRTSGRSVVISKALREIDEETRKQVQDARLDALEADNYNAEMNQVSEDDAYIDEEDEEGASGRKRERRKKIKPSVTKGRNERKPRKVRILMQLVSETDDAATSSYLSAAVGPSLTPARKFCSVCGFLAIHSCRRCGSRYCGMRCYDHHMETRCLKFGV